MFKAGLSALLLIPFLMVFAAIVIATWDSFGPFILFLGFGGIFLLVAGVKSE